MAFGMYPGLAQGAVAALTAARQRRAEATLSAEADLRRMGRHHEPDRAAGRHRSRPDPHARRRRTADGSFAITGSKIFISGGEHDLAANIVHLVLARIDGAPQGTQGDFAVRRAEIPSRRRRQARARATRVTCGAIEEKMGIHGNATCVMNYDGATGWLVGERDKGLRAMFTMMNEARLGVGIQGLGAVGSRRARTPPAYARERRQGRAMTGAKPTRTPPPTRSSSIPTSGGRSSRSAASTSRRGRWRCRRRLHADIARALAGRGRTRGRRRPARPADAGDQGDAHRSRLRQRGRRPAGVRRRTATSRRPGVEQFVRDARIAMIYEGANGIQALDLVGRKLPKDGGRAVMAYFKEVGDFAEGARAATKALAAFATPLKAALDDLQQATHVVHRPMRSPSPTMPAPAPPTTCTFSAWWRSAICGRGSPRRRMNVDQRPATRGRNAATADLPSAARSCRAGDAGDGASPCPHRRRRGRADGGACRSVLSGSARGATPFAL